MARPTAAATNKNLRAELARLRGGGKPPLWWQSPAWTPPGCPRMPGPDYAPVHDTTAWGVERWHGQQNGYRVELIAMRPPGHRAPTPEEGLAEVARRLKDGPPPAPAPAPKYVPAPDPAPRSTLPTPTPQPEHDPLALWLTDERRRQERQLAKAAELPTRLFTEQ